MARSLYKLSAREVNTLKAKSKPYRVSDGFLKANRRLNLKLTQQQKTNGTHGSSIRLSINVLRAPCFIEIYYGPLHLY